MLQEIRVYLNTIKGRPGKIFMKCERDEGSFKISFCVLSTRNFKVNHQRMVHDIEPC